MLPNCDPFGRANEWGQGVRRALVSKGSVTIPITPVTYTQQRLSLFHPISQAAENSGQSFCGSICAKEKWARAAWSLWKEKRPVCRWIDVTKKCLGSYQGNASAKVAPMQAQSSLWSLKHSGLIFASSSWPIWLADKTEMQDSFLLWRSPWKQQPCVAFCLISPWHLSSFPAFLHPWKCRLCRVGGKEIDYVMTSWQTLVC